MIAVFGMGLVLTLVPVTHQVARLQVATTLVSTQAAFDQDWISPTALAHFLFGLQGGQHSDPFCSASKDAAKTSQQSGGHVLESSAMFFAVMQESNWMPPCFAVSQAPLSSLLFRHCFRETPPTPPPQDLVG